MRHGLGNVHAAEPATRRVVGEHVFSSSYFASTIGRSTDPDDLDVPGIRLGDASFEARLLGFLAEVEVALGGR
jgi:hypothetical protein